MYLRISKGRQRSYLVLVEGYRENGTVKQRTICNLGAIDQKKAKQALALGKNLLNKFGASGIIDGSELAEEERSNWGAYEVLQRLWQRYNLDDFWQKHLRSRKIEYDLPNILQAMIAGRLCRPSSKLALFEEQDFYSGFGKFELHNMYKSLDEVDKYKDQLGKYLFAMQQKINGPAYVAFFDVTTMYFESQNSDDLRAFGFSKDCKFNEVQIVLSLLTDHLGNPLAYELFPGNTYEGSTLEVQMVKIKEKYNIEKAVIVADRGMYSRSNLESLEALGFEYIVGTKLRTSTNDIKQELLRSEDYICSQGGEFAYKQIKNNERQNHQENIIAAWSKKRAYKDAGDRERLIEKAAKLLGRGSIQDKRGGKKYLKMTKTSAELDRRKIEEDALWDGYYGVSTNSNLAPDQVLDAYHNLWRIEESFRLMKSYFQTRPMFHWTAARISGHIMINFMAMIFERYLENQLAQSGAKVTASKLRAAINATQKSTISVEGKKYVTHAKLSSEASSLLKILDIKIPKSYALN